MITHISYNEGLIFFEYKGDEIAWNGKQYLSIGCQGAFDTLEDMDKFWEEYAIVSNYVSISDAE